MFDNYILHKGTFNNISPDQWQKLIINPNGTGRIINYSNGYTSIKEMDTNETNRYNTQSQHILQNMLRPLYYHLNQSKPIYNSNRDIVIFIIPILLIILLIICSNIKY